MVDAKETKKQKAKETEEGEESDVDSVEPVAPLPMPHVKIGVEVIHAVMVENFKNKECKETQTQLLQVWDQLIKEKEKQEISDLINIWKCRKPQKQSTANGSEEKY